jgi:ribosomal protein L40E
MTMPAGWNSNQNTQPNLGQEHTIWKNYVETGIINRKVVETQIITNLRVIQNDSRSIYLSDLDDIVVMNQHRESQFHGQRYSFRGTGISYGTGRGSGKSIGDIAFIYQGQPSIIFRNIPDPSGVARLAKAARKSMIRQIKISEQMQAKLQKEEERERKRAEISQNQLDRSRKESPTKVLSNGVNDNVGISLKVGEVMCEKCGSTNPQDAKFCRMCGLHMSSPCSQCGHLNPPGSGFCNSCGHVLA